MAWRVAESLQVLLAEVNTRWPDRDKSSDGSIGDALHATRSSDHNPWVIDQRGVGVVRARDFDGGPGSSNPYADVLVPLLLAAAAGGHPALGSGAYVISESRIWSHSGGWRQQSYSGSNPHDHHTHVSVTTDPGGYDSDAPWGVAPTQHPTEEDFMPALSESEQRRVLDAADRIMGVTLPGETATLMTRVDGAEIRRAVDFSTDDQRAAARAQTATIGALQATVKALTAATGGLTEEQAFAASKAGAEAALADLRIVGGGA